VKRWLACLRRHRLDVVAEGAAAGAELLARPPDKRHRRNPRLPTLPPDAAVADAPR
jgi:hypothetical protein